MIVLPKRKRKKFRQISVSMEVYEKILKAKMFTESKNWNELFLFLLFCAEENVDGFKEGCNEIDLDKVIKRH